VESGEWRMEVERVKMRVNELEDGGGGEKKE
jgi:hypothetical protein